MAEQPARGADADRERHCGMGASPGSSFGQGMTCGEEPTLGSPTATDSTITACGPSRLAFRCDTSRDTSQQYFGHERFEVKLAAVDVRLAGVRVSWVRWPLSIALVEFEAIMNTPAALTACPEAVTYQCSSPHNSIQLL